MRRDRSRSSTNPCSPVAVSTGLNPAWARAAPRCSRVFGSSSTTSTRWLLFVLFVITTAAVMALLRRYPESRPARFSPTLAWACFMDGKLGTAPSRLRSERGSPDALLWRQGFLEPAYAKERRVAGGYVSYVNSH